MTRDISQNVGKYFVEIFEQPSCTWVFDGDSFICTHDETEIVTCIDDYFGVNGHYQIEVKCYACVECGEILEGDPKGDSLELRAEAQLMEILGK